MSKTNDKKFNIDDAVEKILSKIHHFSTEIEIVKESIKLVDKKVMPKKNLRAHSAINKKSA